MDIINAFAMCQTQARSDTHTATTAPVLKPLISTDPTPNHRHLLLLFTINLCKNPSAMRSSFFSVL